MKRKNILISSESESFLLSTGVLLKSMGFNAIPAGSTMELLRLAAMSGADLILIDFKEENFTVLKQIRAHRDTKEVPVVIVSSDCRRRTIDSCMDLGCASYLLKPFILGELIDEICRHFSAIPSQEFAAAPE